MFKFILLINGSVNQNIIAVFEITLPGYQADFIADEQVTGTSDALPIRQCSGGDKAHCLLLIYLSNHSISLLR